MTSIFFQATGVPPARGREEVHPVRRIADYRIRSLLGQGGMGQVWLAEQVSLCRLVALKVVRPELVNEATLALFAREARAGGRLSHPGIVTVHAYGEAEGSAWIAMELVEGAWTLRDFIAGAAKREASSRTYDRDIALLVAKIADALHSAHVSGVIHRDLKPQNILVTPDDEPKVTDFGLARLIDETALSATGDFAGTYCYMSPEQVAAKRGGLDHRTDVFSLGVVLYELLTLRRPFGGETTHDIVRQILVKDPPEPRSLRRSASRELAAICLRCLAKDPDHRFESMAEVAVHLRRSTRGPWRKLFGVVRPARREPAAPAPPPAAPAPSTPAADEVFDSALDITDPAARAAYLDRVCADAPDLRREVDELLGLHESRGILDRAPAPHALAGHRVVEEDAAAPQAGAAPTGSDAPVGRIGGYRIQGLLGEGGMGTVYRAVHEDSGREVALKVVRPGTYSSKVLRRFRHETEALGRLEHPGIARIFQTGTHETDWGPRPFFAMELVEGRALDDYAAGARLALDERLRLLVEVLHAVDHAHRKGVLHRDLKPGNVLVTPAGRPKVVDFGLAHISVADLDLTSLHTKAGSLLGTIHYMSPEQVVDPSRLDARSDVYSLAVIGFELLAGRLPHDVDGRTLPEAARLICEAPPLRLGGVRPNLAGDLDVIFDKALRRDREARYASAAAFAGDLERYLAGGSVRGVAAAGAGETEGLGLGVLLVAAERDEIHMNRLHTQLEPLVRDGTITGRRQLMVGAAEDWREELARQAARAHVVLLLVSPHLLAADVLGALDELGVVSGGGEDNALPVAVVVDACDWRGAAGAERVLALPAAAASVLAMPPDRAWTDVVRELGEALRARKWRELPFLADATARRESALSGDLQELLEVIPGSTQDFVGRERELADLDAAYSQQEVAVYGLIAFGGVGKTSLVHHWLKERFKLEPDVSFLGWSFHSQGTREQAGTSDQFLVSSLEALGDPAPEEGSLWARGGRLARLVAERPSVVVLDGIEPLQYEPGTDMAGQLKDSGLRGFLSEIARSPGRAFVMVTSRVRLADELLEGRAVAVRQLRVLTTSAAKTLLLRRGVAGDDEELQRAVTHLGCHPLALVLASEYQLTFGDGTARSIPEIPLLREDLELGKQAMAIMAAYGAALAHEGEPLDVELLHVLGLFDRAVQLEWLDALRRPPAIPGLTEHLVEADGRALWESVGRLRQWGLMLGGELGGTTFVDTHPLIREYFGERLRDADPVAWRRAHERLFDHLSATAAPFPESLRAMEPLMLAVVHGCKAGLPERALRDVYFPRIQRGGEGFATNALGAGGAVLAMLAHFFDQGRWGTFPPEEGLAAPLAELSRIEVLVEAGLHLAAARSYSSPAGERCYELARELCVAREDRPRLFRVLFGLWLNEMFKGQPRSGIELARRILETAESLGVPALLPASHRALATSHFFRGEFPGVVTHAELGLRHCSPSQIEEDKRSLVQEPSVSCMTYRGLGLWHAGERARGLRHCDRAVERARRVGHPHSIAVSLFLSAIAHQWEGDVEATLVRAEETVRLSGEKGFHIWGKGAQILAAWARSRRGEDSAAQAAVIARHVATWGNNGEALLKPYWLMLLADVRRHCGQTREALPLLEEARALADATGEHWCDTEIGRMAAELLGPTAQGRRWLDEARGIAVRQGSKPQLERMKER